MKTPFTEAEITRRKPVWIGLSDLFLDTDVSLVDARLSKTLKESGFDADEVEKKLREEVGPVFFTNLTVVAGEWAGWPDEWIVSEVTKYLSKAEVLRIAQKLLSKPVVDQLVKSDWLRVKTLTWGAT